MHISTYIDIYAFVVMLVSVCEVDRLNKQTMQLPYKQSLPFQPEQPGTIYSNKWIVTTDGQCAYMIHRNHL